MESNIIRKFWRGLKKFDLSHDDFPTIIGNIDTLLRTMTININKNRTEGIPIVWYILTIIAGCSYLHIFVLSALVQVFIYYPRRINFTKAAFAITLCTCTITCVTKFVFMKMYANDIKDVVNRFIQCDSQILPTSRFAVNLQKGLRIIKKRAISIWVFLISEGIVYLLIPLIRPGRHVAADSYIIFGLEPMLESPNYEIVTLVTAFSVYFAVYVMVNVAVYVIIIVGYNEAQLYALSKELRNLWSDSQDFYSSRKHMIRNKIHAIYIKKKIVNEFITIRLKYIFEFHVANIILFRELHRQFRNTLAVEYSVMTISIIAELLCGLQNTYLQLPFSMVQVVMDCLAGQRLIDACDEFEKALYGCEWENFNISNRKTVLLMLVVSQKTLVLTAGGVTKLNFGCLMAIIRQAYSIYTALKSTLK